ncbi:oxidase [Chryseobacterium sp. T1]
MKDLLFDQDLVIKNGDFVIGDSDNQHQKHILMAYKGEFKANPELGVGIDQMLNEDDITPMLIEAKKNLQYDGVDVNNIYFSEDGKLIVDGKYKK